MGLNYIGFEITNNKDLYAVDEVVFDNVMQKHSIKLKRYSLEYHSRRKTQGEFNFCVQDYKILIDAETPIVKAMIEKKLSEPLINKEIEKYWTDFLEYALKEIDTSWVKGYEGTVTNLKEKYNLQSVKEVLANKFHYNEEQATKFINVYKK